MKKYYILLALFFLGLLWSVISPHNYLNWIAEAAPPIIGLIILASTFPKFRFSFFCYAAILISCYFMFTGAHYSFARMPLFNWIRDYFGQGRNNFDKLGHFVQGVIPVLISREIFIRARLIRGYKLVNFISIAICMAITAGYELIEFAACKLAHASPCAFLGTQGYMYDTQTDMLYATIGGLFTIIFIRKWHDRKMEQEFPGTTEKFNRFSLESDSSVG